MMLSGLTILNLPVRLQEAILKSQNAFDEGGLYDTRPSYAVRPLSLFSQAGVRGNG